jgi:hypothetical protein
LLSDIHQSIGHVRFHSLRHLRLEILLVEKQIVKKTRKWLD